jgi:DNA-binding beta-propeller fold protein YncE
MAVKVGSGSHRYEVVEGWAKLPQGWEFKQCAGVAVDKADNVYVFNRSAHPVMVFDRTGKFIRSFGEGMFPNAHGLSFAADGSMWLADNGDHTVKHLAPDGSLLLTIGTKGVEAEPGKPFRKPTDASVAPNGDIYISDGYGNSRVHVYSPSGAHKLSWGQPGVGDGDFNLPHNIWVDKDGKVFVADRENHRVQLFDLAGKHIATWPDFIQPTDIVIDREGTVYVAELRNRVTICDARGKVIARWGRVPTKDPGFFIAPHGIAVDSRGDLYVGEVLEGQRIQKFARV